MSSCSQDSQMFAGPLSALLIQNCLTQLGWQIEISGDRAIAAQYQVLGEQQEFSAIVWCQNRGSISQVTIRVEANDRHAESVCKRHIRRLLVAMELAYQWAA